MDYGKEILDVESMLRFYQELDVIQMKYYVLGWSKVYASRYVELEQMESAYQFAELTKMQYDGILENLDMIYAERQKSLEIVELFDLIRNKIINQYIGIEGLERLFSEKYIDFEWDMHLGIDYKKHNMQFYREHFVHQIKNAYFIHILLDKMGLMKNVMEVLSDRNNGKISQYVHKCIEQQKICGYMSGDTRVVRYNENDFYYQNIIYMSCYMAALFHDIGYPEQMNTVNQRRITEYIANLYNAEITGYNYTRLNALLQNSLLFRLVPFTEIQKRLEQEKPDHGALSAVMFLLNFYENGAIQGLEPFKKCAVELAALAIYNHTNEYTYRSEAKEGQYIRGLFVRNPIAYLLRLADDLQEWGRIYFEITNRSKLIICNSCKTPIVRKGDKENCYYVCNCSQGQLNLEKQGVFYSLFSQEKSFPYRRIYNVEICDYMEIHLDKRENVICFKLNYDLQKLLNMVYINPYHTQYRTKELNEFKKLLDYQSELPEMKVEYFISSNPILIKVEILRTYLMEQQVNDKFNELYGLSRSFERLSGEIKKKKKEKWYRERSKLLDQLENKMKEVIDVAYPIDESISGRDVIRDYVKKTVKFYLKLLFLMEIYKRYNQENDISDKNYRKFLKRREQNLLSRCEGEEFCELVRDCIMQFRRMYRNPSKLLSNPEEYYEQFQSSEYTYGCISRFVSEESYLPKGGSIQDKNKGKKSKIELDAFTDMELFHEVLKKTERKRKRREYGKKRLPLCRRKTVIYKCIKGYFYTI